MSIVESDNGVTLDARSYWSDIDERLETLVQLGFVKLPPINSLDLNRISQTVIEDMGGATFAERCSSHDSFLKTLDYESYLTPKLHKIASEIFNYRGSTQDQYHIARHITPGNSKESYRAHFDSHLFTMVLPLKIPTSESSGSIGELIFFPNARKQPRNEFSNFIGKVSYKKYASRKGIQKFAERQKRNVNYFHDYCPLLFVGNTTLHLNAPVSLDASSHRLSLLAHFFDPSPTAGVGALLRRLRAR